MSNLPVKQGVIPLGDVAILAAKERAKKLVTKRALVSAGASVLPIPGMDVAVDIGVMISILSAVNQEFGLTPEQIEALPIERRLKVFGLISMAGSTLAGKVVTAPLALALLKGLGVKLTSKQAVRWVPFVGQAVAASVSFGALKILGNQHIEDCARISREFSEWSQKNASDPM